MLLGNERQAAASYAGRRRLGYRYAYRPRRRRRGRAWAAGGGMRRLARQPGRTAWLHDDYDADQLLQHAGWVDREERSGRVLPLHADARRAELPRPQQQRSDPKGKPAATWRQQHQFQKAQSACQHLLPSSGQLSPAQIQKWMNALSNFARCVRSHGVRNWPDPLAESDPGEPGTPGFPRDMPGVNQNSPQVESAMSACQHLLAGIGYGAGGYP